MWDAAALCGLPQVSRGVSAATIFFMFLSIALQLLFTLMLHTTATANWQGLVDLPGDLAEWRYSAGHKLSLTDENDVALVDRVCAQAKHVFLFK